MARRTGVVKCEVGIFSQCMSGFFPGTQIYLIYLYIYAVKLSTLITKSENEWCVYPIHTDYKHLADVFVFSSTE